MSDTLPRRIKMRFNEVINAAELYDEDDPIRPVLQCLETTDDEVVFMREVERRYNEHQHLADIKALRERAGTLSRLLHADLDDECEPTRIDFQTVDALRALDEALAARAQPTISATFLGEPPQVGTMGGRTVVEDSSLPNNGVVGSVGSVALCSKCQETSAAFFDVEQNRWLCDRCHHPVGEPFVHVDDHKNGPCGWSGCGRCGDVEGGGA